ncbi:hypothetical protein B296_00006795 [Ensete ventricosum]|uniref:Uncharacterized protein n=1 Tax=Ensete ventricosum TaxID=4639 RepID=A0A426YUE9_ENSVE|nr:hypothetical protein B296_00006795 [Ensete ventricosum]
MQQSRRTRPTPSTCNERSVRAGTVTTGEQHSLVAGNRRRIRAGVDLGTSEKRLPGGRSEATTSLNLWRRSSVHGNSHRGDLSPHVAGRPQQLRNLRIVLTAEKVAYVLDTIVPTSEEGASEDEIACYLKYIDGSILAKCYMLASMTLEL